MESENKDEVLAGGITAVVVGSEHSRFWIAFDRTGETWQGGHSFPASGILPVAGGKFKLGPSGATLYDNSSTLIGLVNGFSGLTNRGDVGQGHIENPPCLFSWTAV